MKEKTILGRIWKCNLCGFCPKDIECPGFDEDARWESSYGRGKISIVHAMIQDEKRNFQNSALAKKRLFSCTGCAHCEYICPSGIEITKIIYYGRKKLVEAKNSTEAHTKILENIQEFGNPFGEDAPRDSEWPELKSNTDAETVYYPGCMAIYRIPEVAKNTIKIFKELGEKIKILKAETCCSGILYRTGHINPIAELIQPMLDELHENPPKQIIFTCPGCLTAFKIIYKSELGEKFKGIKLLHFSEYLIDKISKLGDIKFKIKDLLETKIKEPVIWHDPCHLARGLGIYEEPRAILDAIEMPYIEFEHNKEDTNCCGSGSGVRSAYPELAEKTTLKRLEEVKTLGARTILTSCPFCEYQYDSVIKKHRSDIDIMDLNTILEKLINSLKIQK